MGGHSHIVGSWTVSSTSFNLANVSENVSPRNKGYEEECNVWRCRKANELRKKKVKKRKKREKERRKKENQKGVIGSRGINGGDRREGG